MILYTNSIVTLDYDPSTDILSVAYPDLHTHLIPEIKNTINHLLEIVRNYDVKKLLLDSTKTLVSVGEEESNHIAAYLATGLAQTRIKKVARLQSPSSSVEELAQRNIHQIQAMQELPFQLRNFTIKAEAMEWLKLNS